MLSRLTLFKWPLQCMNTKQTRSKQPTVINMFQRKTSKRFQTKLPALASVRKAMVRRKHSTAYDPFFNIAQAPRLRQTARLASGLSFASKKPAIRLRVTKKQSTCSGTFPDTSFSLNARKKLFRLVIKKSAEELPTPSFSRKNSMEDASRSIETASQSRELFQVSSPRSGL